MLDYRTMFCVCCDLSLLYIYIRVFYTVISYNSYSSKFPSSWFMFTLCSCYFLSVFFYGFSFCFNVYNFVKNISLFLCIDDAVVILIHLHGDNYLCLYTLYYLSFLFSLHNYHAPHLSFDKCRRINLYFAFSKADVKSQTTKLWMDFGYSVHCYLLDKSIVLWLNLRHMRCCFVFNHLHLFGLYVHFIIFVFFLSLALCISLWIRERALKCLRFE